MIREGPGRGEGGSKAEGGRGREGKGWVGILMGEQVWRESALSERVSVCMHLCWSVCTG